MEAMTDPYSNRNEYGPFSGGTLLPDHEPTGDSDGSAELVTEVDSPDHTVRTTDGSIVEGLSLGGTVLLVERPPPLVILNWWSRSS